MPELLKMQVISKTFPGVNALDKAKFSLFAGEIHALLGENIAGKSTLMKVLSGVYSKDAGEIWLNDQQIDIKTPRQAEQLGIGILHQELNLIPKLTVMENIFLGREPLNSWGFIDTPLLYSNTADLLAELGTGILPEALVSTLSIGEQQMVEIAKALSLDTKILVMDEPTAALTEKETEKLFRIIRRLAAAGVGIIYISHRLEELLTLSDRITVMRDGAYIDTVNTSSAYFGQLIKLLVGRDITARFPKEHCLPGQEVLRIENLSRPGRFTGVSFTLKKREKY